MIKMGTVYFFLMRASNIVYILVGNTYPNTFRSDDEFLFMRILTTVIRCNLSQYINSNDVNHDLLWKVFVQLHLLYYANTASEKLQL